MVKNYQVIDLNWMNQIIYQQKKEKIMGLMKLKKEIKQIQNQKYKNQDLNQKVQKLD